MILLRQEPIGPPAQAPEEAPDEAHYFGQLLDGLFDRSGILKEYPLVQALLVIVAAFIVAKLLDWFVTRVASKLAARTETPVDDQIVEMLHSPIVKSTVVLGFVMATHVLHLAPPWDEYTQHTLLTIAFFCWIPFAFRATSMLLRSASEDAERFKAVEPRTYPLFDNLAKVVLFGLVVYLIITIWEADPAGFLASAGIAGIAIGFAAQDTLSNLIAGVFIIGDAPYRVGDYITLDTGERGKVQHIGLRSTRLLTRDDIEITVPNAVMGKAKIINEAGGPSPKHRLRVAISVAYGSDVDRVRAVLKDVAKEDPRITATPEPRVRFRSFGDSGLHFELLGWIPEPWLRGQTLDALNTAIYKRFAKEGIEIPFPKRDVFLRQVPEGLRFPPSSGT